MNPRPLQGVPSPGEDGPAQAQPRCDTCSDRHRPDLPCWQGTYRAKLCEQVYRVHGRSCWQCRREGKARRATTVDHVVPRMYGGGDEIRNLEPACRSHNSRKGARMTSPYDDPNPVAGNGKPVSSRFR